MNTIFKHLISTTALLFLILGTLTAQTPEAFKYQAVIRDANQQPLSSQPVTIRLSILSTSSSGTLVYQEVHSPTTSALGLVSLNVGEGVPWTGTFADIDWGSDRHYLQVEVDETGGSSYALVGTSELLSVPYSEFAREAATVALIAGEGIAIDGNEIRNASPSLWLQDSNLVFVDTAIVGIGIHDSLKIPDDAHLFVNGNIRIAEDSSLFGVGKIVGANGIEFLGDSTNEGDFTLFSNGRALFEEEVGINQVFSFIDLNVRNQVGNSTVFQVEDTSGNDLFEIGRNGNVGINQITNNVTLQVQNKTNGTNNIILNVERANGNNVLQVQDDNDVVVTGDFSVNSGAKNFILDHPLDPANKVLAHNAVESPDYVTYYHGTITLDAQGNATVSLPEYFEALNTDYHYQLTCIGGFSQVYISSEIQQNQFGISGGQPGMKVSWQVSARRDDPWAHDHPYEHEWQKDPQDLGRYYYPEGYGRSDESRIGSNDQEGGQDE